MPKIKACCLVLEGLELHRIGMRIGQGRERAEGMSKLILKLEKYRLFLVKLRKRKYVKESIIGLFHIFEVTFPAVSTKIQI